MNRLYKTKAFLFVLALSLFMTAMVSKVPPANATLSVVPLMVVIEGRDRFAEVHLVNTSHEEVTYKIDWLLFRQEPDGGYQNLEQALDGFDLRENIVFTPRSVTLPGQQAQKVRLALRLKDGSPPPPGEYRAHLHFMQDSGIKAGMEPVDGLGKGEFQINIGVNVGFSIPIIYRVGESDTTAKIGTVGVEVNPNTNMLQATVPVTRNGTGYGALGNLSVYHQTPDGKQSLIGEIKNANIFRELDSRTFKVALKVNSLNSGALYIVYSYFDKEKGFVYDEVTVPIGG